MPLWGAASPLQAGGALQVPAAPVLSPIPAHSRASAGLVGGQAAEPRWPRQTAQCFPSQVLTLNARLAPSATKLHISLSLER